MTIINIITTTDCFYCVFGVVEYVEKGIMKSKVTVCVFHIHDKARFGRKCEFERCAITEVAHCASLNEKVGGASRENKPRAQKERGQRWL